MQVAASFTQRPPFTCMHMVCTLRDPFRSVNCDGAFNFSIYIYIYSTGSEHLFHNRSCMDLSQSSQNASRCFVYTATTFHVYIHIVCTLCVPFRSCSIVMEPPILFLNTLGRQQTSIHHRSCMDRSQGSQNASRCFVYTATTFHLHMVCTLCDS